MKKIVFVVVATYERDDEETGVFVKNERKKEFDGADSYLQALDYYEKLKKAADSRYTMSEAGLYCSAEFDGKKYVGEYCEFDTPDAWYNVCLSVKVMDL